jgi:hypothetical protein
LDGIRVSIWTGESFQALAATILGHSPLCLRNFLYVGLGNVNEVERQRVMESGAHVVWGGQKTETDIKREVHDKID